MQLEFIQCFVSENQTFKFFKTNGSKFTPNEPILTLNRPTDSTT